MPWPKWRRSKRDRTLVLWRIAWRQGGRYVSVPAGKSRVPMGVDPATRIPQSVKRKLARIENQLTDQPLGIVVPDRNLTLERFVREKWLPRRSGKTIKTQWREGYINPETGRSRGILFHHVLPALGRLPLAGITADHVESFLLNMAGTPYGPEGKPMTATARRTLTVLRKLFNDAKRLGYYPSENPCAGAGRELPDYTAEWWVPSLDGFCRLIAEVPAQWRAVPLVALLTSMGFGELAALDWRHVYFERMQTLDKNERGKIHVEYQVATGTRHKGPLKTRARQRWIDMLWPVREVLMDLPQRKTMPSGLVFAGVHGGYLSHNWWYRKVWQPATRRAGLPGFHFHWLRHGFASLMAAWGLLGEFPLYVAQQMGHADANTTNRVYAKLLREGVRLEKEDTLRRFYAAYKGTLPPVASAKVPQDESIEAPGM